MPTEPYPWFYAVNDRPVKVVELPGREVEVLVYDFATGELVRDMSYSSRVFDHGKDIDKLDETRFDALVAELRSRMPQHGLWYERRPTASRTTRKMVAIPRARVNLGLTTEEADRLALELSKMEEVLHEPGLKAFDVFDPDAARASRREWLEAAMPAHEIEVGPFEIDVYPVTNAEWARYQAETGAATPETSSGSRPHVFVTGISWKEAEGFALHYGLVLPSEAEWEIAARRGRSFFTWGDAYFPQGEMAFQAPVDRPYTVGSRGATASARGVHDLLGHFGEFCRDPLAPYPGADPAWWERHFPSWRGQRVVRGGYDVHQDATCVSRRGVPEAERRTHLKFRCVRRTT